MAAKAEGIEKYVLQLRKQVEKLRETDTKLRSHEVYCQKAKEWFPNGNSRSMTGVPEEESSVLSVFDLHNECKSDMQFSEISGLLSEIKREQKRLLMLKHQLHEAQMQQEVGLLNDILLKQSVLLQNTQHHLKCTTQPQDDSPLAMWFAEITHSIKTNSAEKLEGKFSETNQVFYNVHYCDGTRQPQDLLVETIYKKKMKRDQRKKDVLKEELQFSTCHRGYCVQMNISRSQDDSGLDGQNNEPTKILDPSSYHINFDIHLNELKEHLLGYLVGGFTGISRKSLEDFVRQYVWKEIENLPT